MISTPSSTGKWPRGQLSSFSQAPHPGQFNDLNWINSQARITTAICPSHSRENISVWSWVLTAEISCDASCAVQWGDGNGIKVGSVVLGTNLNATDEGELIVHLVLAWG